jgi:anti-anti-sigma factor
LSDLIHLELLGLGPVSTVRLPHQGPFCLENLENVDTLVSELNSVADRSDCQTLVVDCSRVTILCSDILSKLIVLQRRLKKKEGLLVLRGIRAEAREVLHWTRLDRFFAIQEDAEQEVVSLA